MTDATNRPFDSSDPEQLEQFRKAAAGIIRDILSAVNQTRPQVLTSAARQQWWNNKKQPSMRAPKDLLENAAQNLQRFKRDFVGYVDSLPSPKDGNDLSPDEQSEQLWDLVLRFADPVELDRAARTFNDENFAWDKLCSWESLPEIRRLLDALPDSEGHGCSQTEKPITELVAEPPNVITYLGRPIPGTTVAIWKLLDHLLRCPFHTTAVQNLIGEGWDKPNQSDESDVWIRIGSRLKLTMQFLKKRDLPFVVSGSRPLSQVFLKRREQPRVESLTEDRANDKSQRPVKASVRQSAKKSTRQTKARRRP